jgi:glyoxylase-like metal-dependent hydrolase (beta-lactamase superfamily II)
MTKSFASVDDLAEKKISFAEIGPGLYAFTAQGDPNSGVIVGDDSVMVIDAQATPALAGQVIERIRAVTDKPIRHVALTHYHAVRVLGASAYRASETIMSDTARAMVAERGQEDWESEFARFPRLFRGHEAIPGLTWPSLTFSGRLTIWLGRRRVDLIQLGRAHTAGDIVVHVPDSNVMFTGDIVEYRSACYCGDAHFGDWPVTLEAIRAFRPEAIVPGRGDALIGPDAADEAIDLTAHFLRETWEPVARVAHRGGSLREAWEACRATCDPLFADYAIYEHCLPFNVARAYDEARGIDTPRIWTAERDRAMWEALQG